MSLLDPHLTQTLAKDKQYLEETEIPIVTVSATFREDLKGFFKLPETDLTTDVVFSRAHYSMALGVAVKVWGKKIDPRKAWIVDPTNYVTSKDWFSIILTENIGKTMARYPLLKKLKDLVDRFGRQKLPIIKSITPPLLHLTENINKPVLSFHIAAGNILAAIGKPVVQIITDPHVREDYLAHAELPNIKFCVFDQRTKTELLEKATILGKEVDPKRVLVTGPPIDPRVIKARKSKKAWRSGKLKLCLTTGGIGTNKYEIRQILNQLLPELRKRSSQLQLMLYTGTHQDIKDLGLKLAKEHRVKVVKIQPHDPAAFSLGGSVVNEQKLQCDPKKKKMLNQAKFLILHHPQIVDANELLIRCAFPWADGFITKPSGDMAYDAVAAGCFLLTLSEWGEWEHNIREIFSQKNIARRADIEHIVKQITALTSAKDKAQSWVEQAMHQALNIDKLFLTGTDKIIKAVKP